LRTQQVESTVRGLLEKQIAKRKVAADGVVGMLPLMRYNEGKNCRKKPSSEPKKNGGNAQENNYRRDYKNKPGLLTRYALLLGAGLALGWGSFPLVPSREPGGVGATAVSALCRDGFGVFAKMGIVKLAAFDAFRGGLAIPLGMVEPLAAVALGSNPLFVGPLDGDQKVADRLEFKNFSLVFWDFDQNEGGAFWTWWRSSWSPVLAPDLDSPGRL
jgi:hypothetical protein